MQKREWIVKRLNAILGRFIVLGIQTLTCPESFLAVVHVSSKVRNHAHLFKTQQTSYSKNTSSASRRACNSSSRTAWCPWSAAERNLKATIGCKGSTDIMGWLFEVSGQQCAIWMQFGHQNMDIIPSSYLEVQNHDESWTLNIHSHRSQANWMNLMNFQLQISTLLRRRYFAIQANISMLFWAFSWYGWSFLN